jgi:cell division protein FtsW (lipid II flippase)
MLVSDEAEWAQALASAALLTLMVLTAVGIVRAFRETIARAERPRQVAINAVVGAVMGVAGFFLVAFLISRIT